MCNTDATLFDKVAIVTGGSSGIGLEIAKDLAYRGAKVIIASRNETKLKIARQEIEDTTNNRNVSYKILDLGSLTSVRSFSREVIAENRLNILMNHAGAVSLPDKLTADDLNLTMQVNFFGTFLLTYLLLPLMKASAPSRIINGSAASMYIGHIDFNHWNSIGDSMLYYTANSKLAMTLFTAELDRRLKGSGVTANSFDPFIVRDTNVFDRADGFIKDAAYFLANTIGLRKEESGKQISYLASAPELENVSGVHYKFCTPWLNHWFVKNEVLTRNLWKESKKLVKITPEEDWESRALDP